MTEPRRRINLTLELGADSWRDAARAIEDIAFRLFEAEAQQQSSVNVTSGGTSAGFVLHADEDTSITHDSYFEKINAMIARRS